MNLRSVDLNLLVVFDMLIQERSTTKAGSRLAMSQSAVSKALGRLRALTDDELFIREPGGLVPTHRAQLIAPPVRNALALIRTGIQAPDEFDFASSARVFRLAATDYVVDVLVHRVLDLLSMTAPNIALQVELLPLHVSTSSDARLQPALKALKHGEIDLLVHHNSSLFPTLRCQHLFDDQWEQIVACDVEDNDVRGHVLTGLDSIDALLHARADGPLASVPTLSQLPQVVANTDLAGVVPERIATRHGELLRRTPFDAPSLRTYQFWHEHAHSDRAHKWLRQLLLNHARRI